MKTHIFVTLNKSELEEMKRITRVSLSAQAVLSLARRGLEVLKAQEENAKRR